jgi:two-component system NtrC family sensor kinase
MIFLAFNSSDVIVMTLAGLIIIILLFGFILYFIFSYRHKQRDFILLQIHKNKIDSQKHLLEKTLHDLKAAQALLIQSEKMASLGTLTAGIAHEIQNPLNFVNNFSEVNKDLLNELNIELEKGNIAEAKSITTNLTDNEEKINYHGQRAAAIVKSMLQHSHSSSGALEPTNINALADEYLRLAYHGFRAKDKSFNVTLKTDFDESIGMIKIIPQDIARVILNLITNAFYAVTDKKKSIDSSTQSIDGGLPYEPIVTVTTKRLVPAIGGKGGQAIAISIRDNGPGIPQSALDKIFEPFFTTKPPGEGTGLGLSLSYDIIKAHGGELNVVTKAGEFAEFIITLPI